MNDKNRKIDKRTNPGNSKTGRINGGSSLVTDKKVDKHLIAGGSVVVAENEVNVNRISGGSVVLCFGPIVVNEKISGGASVISSTSIYVNKITTATNLVAAPKVDCEDSGLGNKIVSTRQALNDITELRWN